MNALKLIKKNILWVAAIFVFSATSVQAQKIAVVDINTILESVDEYQQAQEQLDRRAAQWRQDIAQEYDKIKSLYNKYQAEQVLMSDDARQKMEDQITDMEKNVRELQRRKFGPEGELFKRRQELVQPIQDKVYRAIENYANERGYDFIFDKSGSAGMIFNKSEYDKTQDIIKRVN
ncbi:MAG: OmpH family outer membrane protein [Bacteroidota bacterium]